VRLGRRVGVAALTALLLQACSSHDGHQATPDQSAPTTKSTLVDPSSQVGDEASTTARTPLPSIDGSTSTRAQTPLPSIDGSTSVGNLSQLSFKNLLRTDYGPTASDLSTIYTASQKSISSCMAKHGFDRPSFPPPDYSIVVPYYLSYSLEWVSDNGFLPPPSPNRVPSAEEQQVVKEAASNPQYELALSGGDHPEKGCNSTANVAVFGISDIFETLSELDNQDASIQVATDTHADVLAVQAAWTECMTSQGFKYQTLADVYDVQWPSPRPSTQEIAAAVANWNCLFRVHYRETWSGEYVKAVKAYEASNQTALQGSRDTLSNEVSKAKAYLSAAG
jgi:hypothetical protein